MRLRSTIPAVTATALLAAVLAVPGQAMADASPSPSPSSGPVQVTTPTPGLPFAADIQSHSSQNTLEVCAWDVLANGGEDSTGITAVTLHFRLQGDAPGSPDDAVVSGLSEVTPYWWSTPGDVKLPQLGVYDVSAEVTDKAGNDVIVPNVGQFSYAATVTVSDLHAAPSTVDYDHRTVTVTGKAAVTDPRTGGTIAPDQLQLNLGSTGNAQGASAMVGADGTFSATATVDLGPTLAFSAYSVQGRGTTPYRLIHTSAVSNTVDIVREPTRIRLFEPADVYVRTGPVTLKGVVERQVGTGWVPAPDLGVGYTDDYSPYNVTTARDGTFSAVVRDAGVYSFTTLGDTTGLSYNQGVFLYGSTSGSVHVHIPAFTYFDSESYSEDATGEAEFTIGLSTGGTNLPDNTQSVAVQYSPDNRTWHFVGWTRIGRPGVGSNTVQFWANAGANANGYWRVYYPGTADLASAVSPPMHLYRVPTSLSGGRPSTTHAYYGQTVRFGGTLWQQHGNWVRMKNWKVTLVFRPAGSKTWYYVTSGWTNGSGNFSLGARDYRSGTWAVVYFAPDQTHLDAVGPMTYVSA